MPSSIAYFSMEFGLTEVLPQYSGGLGILAGDHLKAASDLGVPIIGVGLLYRAGYFTQGLSRDGWQQELYPSIDPHGLPLSLVRRGRRLGAEDRRSPLPGGRTLRAQVWKAQVGRVPLLLLDSDIEENERRRARRSPTGCTAATSEHRMRQEMLLGIGGVRAVRAYCRLTGTPAPEVFHTNEGHAGFLGLERIRELAAEGLSFDEALAGVRAGTVFTTHTPVPAGIDRFPRSWSGPTSSGRSGPPAAGRAGARARRRGATPAVFNMAHMGLRLAQRRQRREPSCTAWSAGRCSSRCGRASTSRRCRSPRSPTACTRRPGCRRELLELVERENGSDALRRRRSGWRPSTRSPDEELWALRRTLRERLVDEVRRRVHASWLQRGCTDAELGWTGSVFDPDVLTIGFARRVPSYKRLTLMLRDPERLKAHAAATPSGRCRSSSPASRTRPTTAARS